MSHFLIGVIVPPATTDFEEAIEPLLAPYDENKEVDEYDRECYCVNRIAARHARDELFIVHPELEQRRDGLRTTQQKIWTERDNASVLTKIEEDKLARDWALLQADLDKAHDIIAKQHPDYQKPDPTCEECRGSGLFETTYNPNSKWDWYQIGGRWSGAFAVDYDPAKDPLNMGTCFVCNGSGTNTQKGTCAQCQGSGECLKWPTDWADTEGNVVPVKEIRGNNEMYPFSLVLPTGEWAEKGQMGWFGMSQDKMSQDEWEEAIEKILDQFPDHLIVAVDAHI